MEHRHPGRRRESQQPVGDPAACGGGNDERPEEHANPSSDRGGWVPLVQATDVLLVNGGDALYLAHWMRTSGLADMFSSLPDTVYVGLSGGSMVMAPEVGEEFTGHGWTPPDQLDNGIGLVEFSMFPHLDRQRSVR